MSRIGKLPIEIPAGVEVKIDGNTVTAKGPLGSETVTIRPELKVEQQDNKVVAFILAFRDGCDYWSDNYRWFLDNYTNFIYIDRIVIDESYRKRGLAKDLYNNLFDYALKNNYALVCAEIDIEPEYNCPSIRFHEKWDSGKSAQEYPNRH